MKKNILLTCTLGIILIFLIIYFTDGVNYYQEYRHSKIMTEYANTPCKNMDKKFQSDLKNDNLKIFVGGDYLNNKTAKKIGIEIFSNGSYDNIIGVGTNRKCYNKFVEEYFIKNKGYDLIDSLMVK